MRATRATSVKAALRNIAIVLLLGFTSIVPSCTHLRAPEASAPTSLRVMTFNLDKDATSHEDAFRAISDADPDVICFQEASSEWQADLRVRLLDRYPNIAFNQPVNGYDGIGAVSRFPIASSQVLPPAGGGWFPTQLLIVQSSLGRVQIMNVHLRPPASASGNRVIGFLSTPRVRRLEMEKLANQRDPQLCTLIVGDFNEGDGGGAVTFLEHQHFTAALGEFDATSSSWQGQYKGVNLADRPDHLMYSAQIHCSAARIIPEKSSDHDPVVAVFTKK